MQYHIGLGVGHIYACHAALTGFDEPISKNLMDISDSEFEGDDNGAFSGSDEASDEDMRSGSEHSLDRYNSDDDTNKGDFDFDDEEVSEMIEMYRSDFLGH